jgi:hypothetical protein
MLYKKIQVQLLVVFFLVMIPATMFGQYLDGEFTITITSTTYLPEKKDHRNMTTSTTVIQGQVNGKIFRDRVDRYIKNPESRITECNTSKNCPVFTCTSDNSVLRANYSKTPELKEYPLYVKKTGTSNGYKFVNINSNSQEKYVQTDRITASGENSVDKLNLNIISYIAPSDQLAPLLPCYELQFDIGTPLYKLRERAFGEGEWLRWDDIKEKLVPVNEPLPIGVLAKVDPSRKMEDEIYEPLLIKNYKELDEFMLDPKEKVFLIQASGKRYIKGDSHENESHINVVIKLAPMDFMRKPEVILSGCSSLGVGEERVVTAKANKEGGTYRFWAEPKEMLSINSSGSSATLRGSSPGRGTLYVEYTSDDGKKAETSQVAACLQLESYNGGQKIPQIPLFNGDGEKLDGILKVPVDTRPNDATDLIRFVPADPGVLTAVGLGDVIALQGIRPGKTTLQAATDCGATIGPVTKIEVVNCDDETIAELERMRQVAMKSLLEANDDLKRIAGSEEFEKAKEEIVESLVELIAKAGLTIVASGKSPTAAIENATKIAEAGSAVSEMIASGSHGEFYFNAAKAAIGELGGKAVSSLIGVVEAQEAAKKFGNNWAKLLEYENTLKNTLERFEKADRDLQKYLRLQQICKGEKPSPKKKDVPKTESKPDPTKPPPPVKPKPKTEDFPAKQAQTKEAPAKDEVLIDPERPPVPSRQVGLPYTPGDCGCTGSKMLTATAKDFSTLGAGLKNLGACFENFTNTSLTDYQKALTELSELSRSLSSVSQTDSVAFLVKAKESKPQLHALISRVKAYDLAGKALLNKMEKCPQNVSSGMDVLKSVEQITVDSIKAKY